MFGKNPLRPPESGDGSLLQVVNIFPTLQGEGPFVGHPAVFVRLGGCNLACSFCDTEFEAFAPLALSDLLAQLNALRQPGRDLVVITGGEPLRQNIAPLCEALLAQGWRVQIETNGTLWRPLPDAVSIVCSPKMTAGSYHSLRPDVLARVDALKFIVAAAPGDYHSVGNVGQHESGRAIPVYVQPMDAYDMTLNAANTAHALALAQAHGYRLSLQTHKLLGIA
jgi:7-carboxy-7-deazaguanine synthase